MRLSKELIKILAEALATNLETKEMASYDVPKSVIVDKIVEVVIADMQAEDKLNKDVEKLLSSHEAEISRENMDYRKVFELTKQKLAKERGVVL